MYTIYSPKTLQTLQDTIKRLCKNVISNNRNESEFKTDTQPRQQRSRNDDERRRKFYLHMSIPAGISGIPVLVLVYVVPTREKAE